MQGCGSTVYMNMTKKNYVYYSPSSLRVFSGGSDGKESACNTRDLGSIPGLGRSPGEGHSNPLQYSCLENPMDGGAWGHKESDTTEPLTFSCPHSDGPSPFEKEAAWRSLGRWGWSGTEYPVEVWSPS